MHTLETLCAAYLVDSTAGQARSTQYQKAKFVQQVVRTLGALPLEEVTPGMLRAWKQWLGERYTPGTVHKYLSRLGAVLHFGVRQGWLAANPLLLVGKPSLRGTGSLRFLAPHERVRLLAACRESRNPYLYSVVAVALGTGGRKNELRLLCWSEVDFGAGVVRFVQTKTYQPRAVPLVGEACTTLQQLHVSRQAEIPWVFPTWKGHKPMAIDSAWQTARRLAGLEDVRFHDLRHTFASYMAMSGATLREIADVLGHRNIQQSMRYAHLLPSHTKAVVQRMAQQFLEPTMPQQRPQP